MGLRRRPQRLSRELERVARQTDRTLRESGQGKMNERVRVQERMLGFVRTEWKDHLMVPNPYPDPNPNPTSASQNPLTKQNDKAERGPYRRLCRGSEWPPEEVSYPIPSCEHGSP